MFTQPLIDRYYGFHEHQIPVEDRGRWVSFKPIRVIFSNPPAYIEPLSAERWETAWLHYAAMASKNRNGYGSRCPAWEPTQKNWFDKLRWKLHLKLLAWKVLL